MNPPLSSTSRADSATSQAASDFGRLIDTGASNATTKISPDVADPASMVVKALESFAIPIIRAQIHGSTQSDDSDYSHLGREAQALIIAMKDLVASLVRPHLAAKDETNEPAEAITEIIPTVIYAADQQDNSPKGQSRLKKAQEALRHLVFNDMPIRLLKFNSGGSDIALIERSELLELLNSQMQPSFHARFTAYAAAHPEHVDMREFVRSEYCRFAILSHTWIQQKPGEVTYAEWIKQAGKHQGSSQGYQKLVNFCRVAATEHKITLGWMDTICINKDSSSELDESIRSMYNWYSRASVCITYLADTTTLRDMRHDKWFTRGWTLQELLAPSYNKFYNTQWCMLNSEAEHDLKNNSMVAEITSATGIWEENLLEPLEANLKLKMQWAAKRTVTRAEDTSYSLMGIFGVSISTAYGEGAERAFNRLIRAILEHTPRSLPILNFGNGPAGDWTVIRRNTHQINTSSLIPSHPSQFLWAARGASQYPLHLSTPLTLTHLGLHISVLLLPALRCISHNSSNSFTPKGDYFANVLDTTSQAAFNLLHASVYQKSSARDAKLLTERDIIYFGVFNFFDEERMVSLMPNNICFAKPFVFGIPEDNGRDILVPHTLSTSVLPTPTPITFTLQQVGSTTTNTQIRIPKKDLEEKHGMFLRTLYA